MTTNINEIKSDILDLYKEHLSQFIQSNVDEFVKVGAVDAEILKNKFLTSEYFKKFNSIVLATLTKALQLGTIVANDYDSVMEQFNIVASEDDIKRLVVADDLPMPSQTPPIGKRWVKELDKTTNTFTWVLVDAA